MQNSKQLFDSAKFHFPSGPPPVELVKQQLEESTGLEVKINVRPQVHAHGTWFIHFKSPPNKLHTTLIDQNEFGDFNIYDGTSRMHWDGFNRCPKYFSYAAVAAIEDLSGQVSTLEVVSIYGDLRIGDDGTIAPLPDYARVSFARWQELNHGIRPALWKISIAALWMSFLFVIVEALFLGFKLLVALPFSILEREPFLWRDLWRQPLRDFRRVIRQR